MKFVLYLLGAVLMLLGVLYTSIGEIQTGGISCCIALECVIWGDVIEIQNKYKQIQKDLYDQLVQTEYEKQLEYDYAEHQDIRT